MFVHNSSIIRESYGHWSAWCSVHGIVYSYSAHTHIGQNTSNGLLWNTLVMRNNNEYLWREHFNTNATLMFFMCAFSFFVPLNHSNTHGHPHNWNKNEINVIEWVHLWLLFYTITTAEAAAKNVSTTYFYHLNFFCFADVICDQWTVQRKNAITFARIYIFT